MILTDKHFKPNSCKWLVYHFYKRLVYFDGIFESRENAEKWIEGHSDECRNFVAEEVEFWEEVKEAENESTNR